MTSIHIVAPRARRSFAFGLTLVPPHLLDEGALLVRIALPEKAGYFVIAGTNAAQQILDAGGRIRHGEVILEPLLNLERTAEMPLGNLLLELLDLARRQFAWVTLRLQGPQRAANPWLR